MSNGGSENRQGNRERYRPAAGCHRQGAEGRRRRRGCGARRRHLAVARPPSRQNRKARTLGGSGSRAARAGRQTAGDCVVERARAAEEAALAVKGITNSEGSEAGWGRSRVAIAASNGFAGGYCGSHHAISASVIGGSGNAMERDYDFANSVYGADLLDPAEVGRSAGERTIRRLGARKMPHCRCPVVFDPRVARSFISHLLGSISGPSIARGTSFLRDKLHRRIFPEAITITEIG